MARKFKYLVTTFFNRIAFKVVMEILDIVNFDWHASTVTVNVQLWTFWNDSRITIDEFDHEHEGYLLNI